MDTEPVLLAGRGDSRPGQRSARRARVRLALRLAGGGLLAVPVPGHRGFRPRRGPVAYDGHPLSTYIGDSAPGQANGNGLNLNGGLWHEVTASG